MPIATAIVVVGISALWLVVLNFSYPPDLFATFGFVAAKPRVVTLISSMFLHPGIIFLLPNMIFLSILGKQLEDALGRMLFLGVFVISGAAGNALFYVMDRTSTISCTGSAGAVAGIVAAFWMVFPDSIFDVEVHLGWWHATTFAAKTLGAVGAWLAWQFVLCFIHDPMPAKYLVWSNIGGFGAGVALALLVKPSLELPDQNHSYTSQL